MQNDFYISGDSLTITIDGLTLGSYNYTFVAIDEGGLNSHDTVWVTVTIYPSPIISSLGDFSIYEGTIDNELTWILTDTNPDHYWIYLDGVEIQNGSWTSGVHLSLNLDHLTQGVYNYTILVRDLTSLYSVDTVWVTVEANPDPPVITFSSGNFTMVLGATDSDIIWTVVDTDPAH